MGITRNWKSSYTAFRDNFLKQRARDLQRISKATRGEITPEDLEGAAWLAAAEIEKRRGRVVDFDNPADQDEVIAWLYSEFVKFAETKIRNGVRLDCEQEDGNGDSYVSSPLLLAAPESDPLLYFMQCERTIERRNVQKQFGYSQATAYLLLSFQFACNVRDVSGYLAIHPQTFRSRLRWFVEFVKFQPSLYDKTETLNPDYMPPPGRRYLIVRKVPGVAGQLSFGFKVGDRAKGGWRRMLALLMDIFRQARTR